MKRKEIVLALAGAILLSSCSSTVETVIASNESEPTSITTTTETTIPPTPTPVVYDFEWSAAETKEFEEYFEGSVLPEYSLTLVGYLYNFGFTDELNNGLTNFVNERFDREFESVPFSEVDYFIDITTKPIREDGTSYYFRNNLDQFYKGFLNPNQYSKGSLNNKLVLSYLIQNEIPVGKKVPHELFVSLLGENYYYYDSFDFLDHNRSCGNYDSSYIYSNEEMFCVLKSYNSQTSSLCADEKIKTLDITDSPETCEIFNECLRDYYGDNAPQYGQVMTREQYVEIFGEEPLDLSYLPTDSSGIEIEIPTYSAEPLYGEWYDPYSILGMTYTFNADSTGSFSFSYSVMDLETREETINTTTVEFVYEVSKYAISEGRPGIIKLFVNGELYKELEYYFGYEIISELPDDDPVDSLRLKESTDRFPNAYVRE
ncbi:MAG: hypothetical protein K6E72_04050 [Saccharofermentans sp.]|nr:hypothetical protein [Saccharofermentans sp.]